MLYFCTYFDRHYLSRGLALYSSLREHSPPFELHVLCMDEEARGALDALGLPALKTIAIADL